MTSIVVAQPDGPQRTVEPPVTVGDALEALGARRGQVIAALVDGVERDLTAPLETSAMVEAITADSERGRQILRHSVAHIMAQAVTDLFPGAKFAIGPPIADGFYYDFDVETPFTPDDLERIETRMHEIIGEGQHFERRTLSPDEALELFADQPYKREIIEGVDADEGAGDAEVTVYANLRGDGTEWVDLCRGPHLPTTRWVPVFALQRVAGAYWRGDEANPQLQRIYGTAWESGKALRAHVERLEQARARDHRKLGRDLDLISSPDQLGTGLMLFHPRGGRVRLVMEDYSRDMHLQRGYEPVYTPHVGRSLLWETSGHLDFYADSMFPPMRMADKGHGEVGDYYAKPMNCPFHVMIFGSRTRSYRELPLRLAELGTVYRYERSGVVHGLLRARGFTQDDAHIFCTAEQVVDEVVEVIDFTLALYRDFGFVDGPSRVALSTRPPKADTVGTDEGWTHAEAALAAALERSGLGYIVDEGEGAFYGPKIDFQVIDALGRAWQLSTIQVDFNLPERFDLGYVASDGITRRPFMIHRALYGSLERFFAILLEHFGGAFPTWLAPVQSVVVPIGEVHHAYADQVGERLRDAGLRVDVDRSDDTLGAKIRRHQVDKVPYQLIVGDAEVEAGTVSMRARDGRQRKGVAVATFIDEVTREVAERGAGG
ncbi:MAG TPA: threonine--tRNA ligase [Euzebyales bacterium]|nr:threonine--tRNA ligase [Euzebyales bacterium]